MELWLPLIVARTLAPINPKSTHRYFPCPSAEGSNCAGAPIMGIPQEECALGVEVWLLGRPFRMGLWPTSTVARRLAPVNPTSTRR